MYCTEDDVFRVSGLTAGDKGVPSTANVTENILDAQAEVDSMTNTKWESTEVSETYDGTGDGQLKLLHYPIISVSSLTINSTSVTPSNVYIYTGIEGGAMIKLKNDAEKTVFDDSKPQLVDITYKYGTQSVPRNIKRLTAVLASIMTLVSQIGGTYNDITSFSVPEFTAGLGEPYTNIRETVNRLEKEALSLMRNIRILPAVV
ncbi:MAG TPA: hypothetical protein ENK70_07975 [Methylophaga sp.]|nr:hypothetical protein [Methylophaga sp.]